MAPLHRQLLEASLARCAALAGTLEGATVYVSGASGFLAANLLAFLDALQRRFGCRLHLAGSARRPITDVPLFRFLGDAPKVAWTVAAAETAVLPDAERLIVMHTASYGSPKDYLREPLATFRANTSGLVNLLEQAAGRRARQVVYFSSAEVYGQPPDSAIPTPETYLGGSETLSRRAIYAQSKRMAETLGTCLAEDHHLPFTVLRPWNVYGPGQRLDDGRVPIEFLRQARQDGGIRLASNGSPRRAFCYVWDAMRQIAGTLGDTASRAYNIGNSTEEISILELARRCADAAGLPASQVAWDPHAAAGGLQRCAPDVSRIEQRLGSSGDYIPLSLGLRALREWTDFLP